MSGQWFPALPHQWQDRYVAVHATNGCWIWDHPSIEWNTARTLIEQHAHVTNTGDRCAATPTCVNPLHTDRPARVGGGVA